MNDEIVFRIHIAGRTRAFRGTKAGADLAARRFHNDLVDEGEVSANDTLSVRIESKSLLVMRQLEPYDLSAAYERRQQRRAAVTRKLEAERVARQLAHERTEYRLVARRAKAWP
jgi:hypothetical protein